MSTLYIRLPSRSVADNASHWIVLPCSFALVGSGDQIEKEGKAALSDLAKMIGSAQRVVLLLAASDVTLLRIRVPPMSPSRLRIALPNLVEDQLISDPADCVMVAGATDISGLRTVAVMQRGWLQILIQTMTAYGARNLMALPSQLCLARPVEMPGTVVAAVTRFNDEVEVSLRLSDQEGLGLSLLAQDSAQAALEVVETLSTLVPTAPIALYVPAEELSAYQQAIDALVALDQRITVLPDQWSRWVLSLRASPLSDPPNLMTGLQTGGAATVDLRRWRWPIALGLMLLVVNIGALNFQWWRLSREAAQLRTSMVQIYKSAYPKDTVIIDPVAQMRQKLLAAQRDAGELSPDDFIALAAGFGAAWNSLPRLKADSTRGDAIAASLANVEYRERSLLIKPKTQLGVDQAQLKSALAANNLTLSQSAPGVWQIRSAK